MKPREVQGFGKHHRQFKRKGAEGGVAHTISYPSSDEDSATTAYLKRLEQQTSARSSSKRHRVESEHVENAGQTLLDDQRAKTTTRVFQRNKEQSSPPGITTVDHHPSTHAQSFSRSKSSHSQHAASRGIVTSSSLSTTLQNANKSPSRHASREGFERIREKNFKTPGTVVSAVEVLAMDALPPVHMTTTSRILSTDTFQEVDPRQDLPSKGSKRIEYVII